MAVNQSSPTSGGRYLNCSHKMNSKCNVIKEILSMESKNPLKLEPAVRLGESGVGHNSVRVDPRKQTWW